MSLLLSEIRDLAFRFVPGSAADPRLYLSGARSWWPAHELGHFLVANAKECCSTLFGLEDYHSAAYCYAVSREMAATSISQRLLRRSGHSNLADEELMYTDDDTLISGHESWCKRAVYRLLRENRVVRLPTTFDGLETLLARKAREVRTASYPSRRAALTGKALQEAA